MPDDIRPSLWLDDLPPFEQRPSLPTDAVCDVVIVGGGFSGLWTAYHLLQFDPGLSIVLLESEYVGFGASGRNGGWATSAMSLSPDTLADRYGPDGARQVIDAMRHAVDELDDLTRTAGIECDYRKRGILLLARGRAQVPGLRHSLDVFEHLGRAAGLEWLGASEARERVRATRIEAGLYNPHGASVHPARLARGLAEHLTGRGVQIYEGTAVTDIRPGDSSVPPIVRTAAGEVRATTVVLAAEAWMSRFPGYRRSVLPVYSLIVATEPLSESQWRTVGWDRGESLASYRFTVDYLTRTADGRILFGGRGAPYHYGSRIDSSFDHHRPTHARLRRSVVEWWPDLAGIGFSHAWGGPLGITRDFTPNVVHDRTTGVATVAGYVGQGVTASLVAGRHAAAVITDRTDAVPPLPFASHSSPRWEPEPLRWMGARLVQTGFARLDRRGERTGLPATGRSLAERLFDH